MKLINAKQARKLSSKNSFCKRFILQKIMPAIQEQSLYGKTELFVGLNGQSYVKRDDLITVIDYLNKLGYNTTMIHDYEIYINWESK